MYSFQLQVTPLPPGDDIDDNKDHRRDLTFFLRTKPDPSNESSSLSSSPQDWTGGITDETSLGHSVSAKYNCSYGDIRSYVYNY